MTAKRILQSIVVVVILAASFASTGAVFASSGCAGYITVQSGDTLSGIATACGISVEAILAANPGLGSWLYVGQVIYIPTGYNISAPANYPSQTGGNTYVIQWGDTLGDIATRNGVSMNDILAVNPQVWNASLIFPGQVINLPAPVNIHPSTNYPSTYNPYNCTPTPDNPSACNPSAYNPYNCIPSPDNPSACNPSTDNPSTYNPNTCIPSPYNPSACNPSTYNPSTYSPSTYNPNICISSPNNPSACNLSANYLSTYYPSPIDYHQFSVIRITYGHGLLVRTGPGKNYSEIKSPLVSAVKRTNWRYRKASITVDSTGLVWVEISLGQAVDGYSTGWIMVRDMLGNHFTKPEIDPKIDP